jgi:hypothetical protein
MVEVTNVAAEKSFLKSFDGKKPKLNPFLTGNFKIPTVSKKDKVMYKKYPTRLEEDIFIKHLLDL